MRTDTFEKVCVAIAAGRVHVSEHAHDEALDDEPPVVEVIDRTPAGEAIEDYPTGLGARAAWFC